MDLGIPCGGWCPKERLAEDGSIPLVYPLRETPSTCYSQRTKWNIRDSDATLVLHGGTISGGTALTVDLAAAHKKPCLCVMLTGQARIVHVADWLKELDIATLNVAGPRESQNPGIYRLAYGFLKDLLSMKT
jgi:hypothetical protein